MTKIVEIVVHAPKRPLLLLLWKVVEGFMNGIIGSVCSN